MQDVKNIKKLLIAGDISRTANVQALDKNLTSTYFVNGEIVVTDPAGVVLTSATALKSVDRIFIKQRASEGDGVYVAEVHGKSITGYFCKQYVTASEQVSTLTNPSISLVKENTYWVKVTPIHTPLRRDTQVFSWRSGFSVPTQLDVLVGLADNINLKGSYDSLLRIKAEVAYNGNITPLNDTTSTVTHGSKTVTSVNHGITTLGTYIDIDGVIYKVAGIPGLNTLTLSCPYIGVSKVNAVISSVDIPLAGADTSANLVITGLPYEFKEGMWNYDKAKFVVGVSEDIETQFTTVASTRGSGTYEEVREMEYYTKNFFGNDLKHHPIYPVDYLYDSEKNQCYDLVTITWENTETRNIAGNDIQMGAVVIAIPTGAVQGDTGTSSIIEVLNKYVVTEHGIGSAITLSA